MLDDRDLRFDLFALGLLALTVFMGLSLVTYSPADPLSEAVFPLNRIYQPNQCVFPLNTEIRNACGHAGAVCADMLLGAFGLAAFYVVGCLFLVDVWLLMRRPITGAPTRLCGWLLALVGGVTLLQMFAPNMGIGPVIGPGGFIGAMGKTFLEAHFATVGSLILLGGMIVGGTLLCTDYVLLHFGIIASIAILNMVRRSAFFANLRRRFRQAPQSATRFSRRRAADEDGEYEEELDEEAGEYEEEYEEEPSEFEISAELLNKRARGPIVSDLSDPNAVSEDESEYEEGEYEEEVEAEDEYEVEAEGDADSDDAEADEDAAVASEEDADGVAVTVRTPAVKAKRSEDREEVIASLEKANREYEPQDYELPPIDLLNHSESYNVEELTKEVKRKASLLEKTFEDFNLDVKVVDIETGPVIAQYEVALKRGLRLSKITGLADDLAIALRVPSVRIVAPIPGKNTVGIEVPNDDRQIVRLREVMNETNGHIRKMAIPIFLGKDVSGNPLAVDLAKLPHLLIAGRTGTGKSVCLNAIITSVLMTKTPDDVRMLMIDPKMVELSGYARLPHLMHPVVTDMRKAEAILAWACEKMDERYQLLARAGVRHVSSYNQLGEEELMERLKPETEDEKKLIPRHLPYIVIIADEMADLMMTAGKEVEAHIIRLSAKSRAVGIHLILATQKPTVDVITGLIKSNLPARLAFQVASKTDSRVVLDENGADKLLGYGDMLLLSPGTSTLLRGQGTFLSDDEIDRVVDYCGSKGEQNFVRELVQLKVEDKDEGEAVQLKKRDDLYEDAIGVVVREGRGSVSLLQRNLEIGYGRAARLIDFMAEDGIVGAYNGSKAREVLMTLADWEATKAGGGGTAEKATASPQGMVIDGVASKPGPSPEPVLDPVLDPEPEVLKQTVSKIVALPSASRRIPDSDTLDDERDELDEELEDELEDALEEEEYEEEYEEEELDGELEEDAEAELDEDEEYEEEEDELEDELEDEEAELEEEEDELEDEEAELEEDEEDVEYEDAESDEEYEDADEYEEVEDEYDGEEFEQEDFDDEEFAAAVAKETGLDADEYEDVEDFDELAKDVSELGEMAAASVTGASTKKKPRSRRKKVDDAGKRSPRTPEKGGNRVIVHRSHAD